MRKNSSWKHEIESFLAQKRIAIAGVSRNGGEAANVILRKLRATGYETFPVNPAADRLEGALCYPDLEAIPGGVDAVVVATPPGAAPEIIRSCIAAGVRHVWMHRSFGPGSFSEEGVALARANGISVIPGGCPMMFCEPVDVGHRCMRWFLRLTGGLPKAA